MEGGGLAGRGAMKKQHYVTHKCHLTTIAAKNNRSRVLFGSCCCTMQLSDESMKQITYCTARNDVECRKWAWNWTQWHQQRIHQTTVRLWRHQSRVPDGESKTAQQLLHWNLHIYRVGQIKWHHFTFLLVTYECIHKILWFLAHINYKMQKMRWC